MAYGYNANSGGEGAIAIGSDVSSNTKILENIDYEGFSMHTFQKEGQGNTIMGFDLNGAAKAVLEDSKLNSGNYFSKKDNYIDALEEAIAATDFVKDITIQDHSTKINEVQSNDAKNAIVIGSRSGALGDNSMAFGRGTFAKEKTQFLLDHIHIILQKIQYQ